MLHYRIEPSNVLGQKKSAITTSSGYHNDVLRYCDIVTRATEIDSGKVGTIWSSTVKEETAGDSFASVSFCCL
jgi:hypothetical protein